MDYSEVIASENYIERFFILPWGEVISFLFPHGKQWAIAFRRDDRLVPFLGAHLMVLGYFSNEKIKVNRFVSNLEELV